MNRVEELENEQFEPFQKKKKSCKYKKSENKWNNRNYSIENKR